MFDYVISHNEKGTKENKRGQKREHDTSYHKYHLSNRVMAVLEFAVPANRTEAGG